MGGGGSTEQQSSQQSVQQVQLPPWVNQAAQQNYAFAQNVAGQPLQQFQGQQVANIGPQTQQAWNLAAGSGSAGADQYNASQAGYFNAASYQPNQITAPGMAGLQPWMSPYTQQVINTSLPLIQQQTQQALMSNNAGAAGANAFGGSRLGVQQGVAATQGGLASAQLAAQLQNQNFTQAQNANLAAQQANQQANQAAVNSQIQAAGGLGNLGAQAQQNQRQQFLELSTAGAQQQQQQQNQIQAQINAFNQAQQYPGTQLGILQSALGMTPYGSTTIGSSAGQQQQQTNASLSSDIFGGLQALGGLAGAGGPFAAGGLLSGLFTNSDRHLKTDVTRVGTHQPTGLPLYSYRYKGDPKSYPKVVGPMAEDAMQVMPSAVRTVGRHPSGQAVHQVDMAQLDMAPKLTGIAKGRQNDLSAPSIRPTRLPQSSALVPGAMAQGAPMGLTGALGASMRPAKLRKGFQRLPNVAGALGGLSGF